jgi:hypothetical protein
VEVKPHARELIVVAILPDAVRDGLEDPLFDQSAEAIGQDGSGARPARTRFEAKRSGRADENIY